MNAIIRDEDEHMRFMTTFSSITVAIGKRTIVFRITYVIRLVTFPLLLFVLRIFSSLFGCLLPKHMKRTEIVISRSDELINPLKLMKIQICERILDNLITLQCCPFCITRFQDHLLIPMDDTQLSH